MMIVSRHYQPRCFTLVELLVTTTVMLLVVVALLNLYLFPFQVWHNNVAWWTLTTQGKLIRERLLCGVDGDAGLRAATMSSLQLSHEQSTQTGRLDYRMDMGLPPTTDKYNDDLNCALRFNPGQGLVFQATPGNGQPVPLSRHVTEVGSLTFTTSNRVLTTQIELRFNGAKGSTVRYPMTIQTYISND
ncbi:MAG: hypothetical protein WCH61_00410 [bacterium]